MLPEALSSEQAHNPRHSLPMRRSQALEQLAAQLRQRGLAARIADTPEAHKLPTLNVSNTDTFTRAHVEVRAGLGNIDWYAWLGSGRLDGLIAPADSPAEAAGTVVEALS